MFSPEVAASCYEIWLSAPGGVREVFDLQRVCGSREEGVRLAAAVADWLHLGAWFDGALDALPPGAQGELFALRQGYKADGVPLGLVRVGVKPVAKVLYDRPDDEDDDDPEDTPLEPRNDTPSYSVVPDDDYDLI